MKNKFIWPHLLEGLPEKGLTLSLPKSMGWFAMITRREKYIRNLRSMDTDQRLGSLLFELHFEDAICPAIRDRKPGLEFLTGWIAGAHNGQPVALKSRPPAPNHCDMIFAEHLRKHGWETVWLDFDDDRVSFPAEAPDWLHPYAAQVDQCLSELRQSKPNQLSQEIIGFLEALPENTLQRGWRSRSVINGLMKAGMVLNIRDIDAVFFSEDRGLSLIEFKRKLPMKTFFPLPGACAGKGLPKDIFTDPEQYETENRERGRHYGLDLFSHVRSVTGLHAAGIPFWYLILRSGETSPSRFFDDRLQPLYDDRFLLTKVTPCSFRGITFTEGKHTGNDGRTRNQSGSFNSRKRHQLTIPEDSFWRFGVFDRQINKTFS